jgi:hypothetical protein
MPKASNRSANIGRLGDSLDNTESGGGEDDVVENGEGLVQRIASVICSWPL